MTEPRPAHDLSRIVKANDVRGKVGVDLDAEIARALGAALVDFLEAPELVVAHDMRLSSPELSRAVIEGAVRRGAIVAEAGLASTDQLYCASGLHRAAGVMITASHNPPGDNGMKLCLPGARPIGRDSGLNEIARAAEAYLDAGEIPRRGEGRAETIDTLTDYVELLHRLVPLPEGRRLRVVVDAGSGMAGHTAPGVLGSLPQIQLIGLHLELDGTFPHRGADPLRPENLVALREAVVAEEADLGLAFDGDADRCVVLDETGATVPPSALTALIAEREIARARAAGEQTPVVVSNVVSSRHVEETVRAAGAEHVRTPVGHARIKTIMAEHNAVFGGEHSAHYYFRDFFSADSGMLAALHILAALGESDGTASELVASHAPYAASGEINTAVADPEAVIARVREHAESLPGARLEEVDGLNILHWDESMPEAERWWASLRSSHTEALLRLNVEAAQEETMQRVRDELLALRDADAATGEPAVPADDTTASADDAVASVADAPRLPAGASGADVPSWVRALLRCPDCGGELADADQALQCLACGRVHAVEGGIPVLIAGRAEAPETR